jgi:glycosyltransferase involved in cell wall biosynthesis
MMGSVQLPRHIEYEFVVVDGGSDDGTLEWLAGQERVTVIEHGSLLGAIKAFCDGAKAATGDYVIMANDDILFQQHSIMRALSHLEDHSRCGAVAFADNRSKQFGKAARHRVEIMPAVNTAGEQISVNYAQVGMFRRWLGDRVGWWGSDDHVMSQARTYGGDNFLSSSIWDLGYSVDEVEGCMVDDIIPEDELRASNISQGPEDSALYYRRFPQGAQLKPYPVVGNPQRKRLRIVVLPIYEPSFPAGMNKEYGLSEALAKVGLTWEVDFVNTKFNLAAIVKAWQPHVMITQIHAVNEINAANLSAARAQKPDMVIVNWNGDAHEQGLTSPEIMDVLEHVDLQTVVNAKVLPVYEVAGIKAAYWQIAYKDPAEPHQGIVPAHDVVFLGNCYSSARERLVAVLNELGSNGTDVGLYGSCPGAIGNNHYSFAEGRALYERCKIAISDTFPGTVAFVSNRLFQALAAGAFVLHQRTPELDEYTGLKAGVHYIEWGNLRGLKTLVKTWAAPDMDQARAKIAQAGREFVRENFSYDAQVKKLWELLP